MDIKINMLNVKDGDAIIVELIKPNDTLVMVIDGGEMAYYESKVKPKLQKILKEHHKKAPDVVVCTHYDSDHIGGLIPLVKDYIDDISQVWVHSNSTDIKKLLLEQEEYNNKGLSVVKLFNEVTLENDLIEESGFEKSVVLDNKSFVLESLNQLNQLINLIPGNKLKQVFYNDNPLVNWPEVQVLGPTKEYFENLFSKGKKIKSLILEELDVLNTDEVLTEVQVSNFNLEELDPCDKLKSDTTAKITSTNKASIIIAIDNDNGRYLFTGDAGVESFKKIPNWQTELKNLFFLKVPHHGSNNNMTKEIAEKMKPKYAYCSGDTFQDEEVIECLAQKTKDGLVATTKANGDLYFNK